VPPTRVLVLRAVEWAPLVIAAALNVLRTPPPEPPAFPEEVPELRPHLRHYQRLERRAARDGDAAGLLPYGREERPQPHLRREEAEGKVNERVRYCNEADEEQHAHADFLPGWEVEVSDYEDGEEVYQD